MNEVTPGDKVKVHYTGKFADGRVFDSSVDREPLEVLTGQNQVIPGFEKAIIGMKVGETKSVSVSPEEGYGEKNDAMFFDIKNSDLPDGLEPKIGMPLEMVNQDGGKMLVTISEVNDDNIKIDANHPLAGEHLKFDIELVEIL
jgi:peptidylprolyl isomerase